MSVDIEAQRDEILALASIYENSFIESEKIEKEFLLDSTEKITRVGGLLYIDFNLESEYYLSFINKLTNNREKYAVQYLPPLKLKFDFPLNYPSRSAPNYTLSCKWLNVAQISYLCKKLDEQWELNESSEIMFTWAQYLKDQTFDDLSISDCLDLEKIQKSSLTWENTSEDPNINDYGQTSFNSIDKRAIQDVPLNSDIFLILREFDIQSRKKYFDSKTFTCDICFESKIGNNCLDFWPCHHVFCKGCIKSFFEVQIQEGYTKLKCPEIKCESDVNPKQVEELVSKDLFKKWDERLLNSTLFSLDDIQPCPRKHCQYPVTIEEGQGYCPNCSFVFCSLCRFGSHGVEKCKFKSGEAREIMNNYLTGPPSLKKELEDKYGKKYLGIMVQEYLTMEYIDKNAKECPRCRSNIEKIDGCNKMTCNRCGINFCWLCEKMLDKVNPYSHFNTGDSRCFNMLFHGIDVNAFPPQEDFQQEEEIYYLWEDEPELEIGEIEF